MLSPFAILAIGIATVIGLIVFLRINAFIALITAAIVVSLLAPGAWSGKIGRVALAFGETAGNIGIVIALAAVIGTCMMDSGAADRIVRAFLRLLGQKRAPFALMGSGFVLSVPVFFDTVFYLLVPLARSLYRRTRENYLMYLLAIAAGGAITHTLVPPTPGPLVMAEQLGVDIGMMILVGGLVALPAAFVGVACARLIDRRMPIPMRQVGTEPEAEPLADSELPPLWLSLLPVVLPVVMISASTVLNTIADAEGAARFTANDITDWPALTAELATASESDTPSPARRLMSFLEQTPAGPVVTSGDPVSGDGRGLVIAGLNSVISRRDLYDAESFAPVLLPQWQIEKRLNADASTAEREHLETMQAAYALLGQDRLRMRLANVERMNRLLLEVAFPEAIAPHHWQTSKRQAAEISDLFGNANLALLVSTAVALLLLWSQRRPTLLEMSKMVELSLMSGGAIILITAAGGAFGAMLKTANIGQAIQDQFAGGTAQGTLFLVLGFGIAALMKVAQGSGTVSMITTSAMIAAMLAPAGGSPVTLPFHAVYLATAIGAGSLIGSWMNDSGFWIFAKMGGLTEMEGLKSWTILLIVLGIASMATTVVLSMVLPLV